MTTLNCLLVSSNIGSICEDPDSFLVPWITEIKTLIEKEKADFFAVGFQEVGGQKKVIKNVDLLCERFFKVVVNDEEWWSYGLVYETDVKSKQFTALGCIYCVRKSFVPLLKLWNFKTSSWESLASISPVTSSVGCSVCPYTHHKRFENTDSRKGFLQSRWSWGTQEVDLINVHLYHDESNVIASQEVPSVYAEKRVGALKETLDKCQIEDPKKIFIFGDLNFRLDLAKLVPWIKNRLSPLSTSNSSEPDTLQPPSFSEEDLLPPSISVPDLTQAGQNDLVPSNPLAEAVCPPSLLLEDKKFSIENSNVFYSKVLSDPADYADWRSMDCELKRFNHRDNSSAYLDELPIHFIPTYPIRVKAYDKPSMSVFSSVRAPAWTDRVLFTRSCRQFMENNSSVKYDTHIGEQSVGDHLPVHLTFSVPVSLPETESHEVAAKSSSPVTTPALVSDTTAISSEPSAPASTTSTSLSHFTSSPSVPKSEASDPSSSSARVETLTSSGGVKLKNEWLLFVFSDHFVAHCLILVILYFSLNLFYHYT